MAFEITKQEILKQAIALNKLWKETRDQKYRDEELRLRRIALELENTVIGGGGGAGAVRTIDSYTATEGQTDFTISASEYSFADIYVNGARLISGEYITNGNIVTLNVAAELDDEVTIVSYYGGSLEQFDFERRQDFVSPYSYCGKAPGTSSESADVWTITRIEIFEDGTTSTTKATDVNWTNRYTHTYS